MKRWAVLLYGITSYALFFGAFLYLAAFIGGFLVPTTLDSAPQSNWATALAIDLSLILLFGLQHSVMARPAFKAWLTRIVPTPIERSTYVLATNVALGLLFVYWQPLGGVIWKVEEPFFAAAIWCLFGLGWLTVLVTTFLINHFDLFGLRQVWLYFRGRPYTSLPFVMPGPYRVVRHPLYVGWLIAFWATPTMTVSHLLFAAGMTTYILIAIQYEERDLVRSHGDYADYRRRVPMLIPRLSLRPAPALESGEIRSSN